MRNSTTPIKTSFAVLAIGLALGIGACGQGLTATETPDLDAATTTTASPPATSQPTTTTIPSAEDTTTTAPPVPTTTTTAAPSQDAIEVMVYLFDPDPDPDDFMCEAVAPVSRFVEPPELLAGAFEELLRGPSDQELEAGYGSWFSAETGWSVDSATISNGVAQIDFSEDSLPIPNASTSCGSIALRAQLDSTAMQFPAVDRTVYSLGGDVAAFYHWLQADVPEA
jgi:spore germination protein GerM